MRPIIYKLVKDHKGTILGLELYQDGQHIVISLEQPGSVPSGYKWLEVKKTIDDYVGEVSGASLNGSFLDGFNSIGETKDGQA